MTVCGNKLSGVCGACKYIKICRNNEIANLPKSNIEWMREASMEELAEVLADVALWIHPFMKQKNRFELLKKQFYEWLKQPHTPKE